MKKVTPKVFIAVWELAPSIGVVATVLCRSIGTVRSMADRLRRAGVNLKSMPTRQCHRSPFTVSPSVN